MYFFIREQQYVPYSQKKRGDVRMNETYSFLNLPPEFPVQIRLVRVTSIHKHWHSTVELILVLRGTVAVEVQEEVSSLGEGDLLLINSSMVHELRSADHCLLLSLKLDMAKFDLPKEEAEHTYFACDSSKDEDKTRYDNLRALIALIVERNVTQDAATIYDNKSFAYSLLRELMRDHQVPEPEDRSSRIRHLERMDSIVRYVETHYRDALTLNQLAKAMHLSPPYLSAMFSRYLSTTFSDYYNSVRLGHAVSDLTTTDLSIDAIALNNGYANTQAFGRAFRAKYSTQPSVYRQQHRKTSYTGVGRDGRTSYPSAQPETDQAMLDLSLLFRYLPRQNELDRASGVPDTQIQCRWTDEAGTFGDNWRRLIGIGSAKEILYREVQRQLEDIQAHIGFTYIKFHGLFSDEMMVVTRTADGKLDFNFHTIDMVFDYLFSIGLKPLIQLSFMPIELAKDRRKIIFNNHYNTSQPARLEEWVELVRCFFLHIIQRYGKKKVAELPVILWNNADSSVEMFGMQDDRAFFRLYRETVRTIREIDPRIQIGAPSMTFMHLESTEWARRFYRWELAHDVKPDFFCSQFYSVVWKSSPLKIDLQSWQPDHLVTTQNESSFQLQAGIPLSTDPDRMKKFLGFLDEFCTQEGLKDLPVWITEWNISVSHNNLISDTMFAGCYVIKNVLEHSQGLQALGYWCATDFIEEQSLPRATFHGGLGLITVDGVRKPQFLAYQTLRQLKSQILAQDEGYIVTRSESCIAVLLYNYEHFSNLYANNKTYNVTPTDRYTPFTRQLPRQFHLQLAGLPDRPVLEGVEFITNRDNGSAFDFWVKMGSPEGGVDLSLDRYRLERLKDAAHPFVHSFEPDIKDGVLHYAAQLEPLEFRLIQITFR